jgi:hypothetical protein
MTLEEVIDFFAPEQSTTDAVTKWLEESGISPSRFAISANKQVLTLPKIMWSILDVPVDSKKC